MNPRPYPLLLIALARLGLPLACTAHPLDLWSPRCTNFLGVLGYQSAAYGNGTFVAAGGAASIAYSSNGAPWTQISPTNKTLLSVAFGGGKFVAVGDSGLILTSSNGINWDDHSTSNSIYLRKIAYGNSRFVAMGYTISPALDYTVVSTDAVTWTTNYLASNKTGGAMTFGNGLFVYPVGIGTNLLSADGLNWIPSLTGLTNDIYMIGSGVNSLVIFDIHNRTYGSADGTNWALLGTNSLLRPEGLAYGNGYWLAVGRDVKAQYSTDLVKWTSVTNNGTMAYGITFGNGTFVTVNTTIYQSATIITLQALAGLPGAFNLSGPTGVTYQIQAADTLNDTNWQTIDSFTPVTSPALWIDPDTSAPQKFYRALLP